MPNARAGHHGDVLYAFEDTFDTSPTSPDPKVFGSNATMDTFDGSHEAVRVFNADRRAADIIEQVFDGSWSVTCQLSEPPWYLAGLFGQPSSTQTATTGLYDHVYDLDNNNDPVSLRLYAPTDGFSNYEVVPGAVVASIDVNQSVAGIPEVTISGAYAREPFTDNTLSLSIPAFAESTFSNRDAELTVDGTTVGRAQTSTVSLAGNTQMVNEIGSESAVDFVPRTFEPDVTHEKILWVGQSTDPLSRFKAGSQVNVILSYDNGQTGTDEYTVDWDVQSSLADQWSESGRNDPEADLIEELQEMGEDAVVTVTEDVASPPGV